MPETQDTIDRITPTRRPDGKAIGYHRWSDLLFVHWRISAFELQPLLPAELTVDTFDHSAWVGLVPFHMSGVRPTWFPAVPGISSFHETNVRTYVHFEGRDPGVWFFSLDASSSLAVRIARFKWSLPYYRAAMQLKRNGRHVRYFSERLWPGIVGPGVKIEADIGDQISALDKDVKPGNAVPGTLEHFLVERYILYSQTSTGQLQRGRVYHHPYPLQEAQLVACHENLLKAAKITPPDPSAHTLFSPGVDVEIFPLRNVTDG